MKSKIKSQSFFDRFLLGIVLVVSAILRFYHVGVKPIWHDEAFSYELVKNFGFVDITTKTSFDAHPPMYYYLLKIWGMIGGYDIAYMRVLSVVLGVLLVFGIYLLATKLFNKNIGIVSAAIACFSPFMIEYSQEARMYSLVAVFVLFAIYFFIRALHEKQIYQWILFVLLSSLGMYTQYFGFFVMPISFFLLLVYYRDIGRRDILIYLVAAIAIAVLYTPWLPSLYQQFTLVRSGFWIPPVGWYSIPGTFIVFLIGSGAVGYNAGVPVAAIVLLAMASALFFTPTGRKKNTLAAVVYLIIPILLTYLVSLKMPLYINRYFLMAIPAFIILIGIVISNIGKYLRFVLIAAIIIYGIGYSFSDNWGAKIKNYTREAGIRDLANYVQVHIGENDIVASTSPWHNYFVLNYYIADNHKARLLNDGVPQITEAALIEEDDIFNPFSVFGYPIETGSYLWIVSDGLDDKVIEVDHTLGDPIERKNFGPMVLSKYK